ncbi:M1 family metallopeptidase [Larkinella terrae]|uniref:M1 family peptidase n=1 Tax=Larkinella terrae TaxID=2025311 RepID=A0A7K0EFD3_9BACT|nr:M1 family metallopeptidase [Larkinella terrae]MRS60527.1 M1 family peptidase [Larkinella terrae]
MNLRFYLLAAGLTAIVFGTRAQTPSTTTYKANDRFEQMGQLLPTPNTFRTASGAPGRDFFQNRADYDIKVELDDVNQKIIGSETVTYFNNSPDELKYIWLQLEQNYFEKGSIGGITGTGSVSATGTSTAALAELTTTAGHRRGKAFDGDFGYKITAVKDKTGKPLKYTINQTMMRIDLPAPLKPGQNFVFGVDWNYNITEYYGRSGYEFFPKDGNYNYFIAHWFPRMAVYDDVNGWQHKQFLGQGEFTLIFGNYKVAITVPNDHVVAASGECQNYKQVLSATQAQRMQKAANSKTPVVIVTQAEAEAAEKGKPTGRKTWIYKADNVRDFAFASSRKFIWDAMQTDVYGDGRKIWSMSVYPKEGNPLWGQYSTRAVEHTLKSYGNRTFKYPYPVAISCHATPGGGMEYPMISFNGGRPEPDGTYSEAVKAGMIGVIIHEVGHNFFPMIVNSDERQWAWMDEGLNTFCQYLAEKEWDYNFPTRRGEPYQIVDYMKSDPSVLSPIMTSSENVINLGSNAYAKPAAALNILRETVMGRELFDYAFKEYSRRWMFKNPTPADFFRTMEDASGVDLDWFWKGWFYGVEPVDQDLVEVDWFTLNTQNPEVEKALARAEAAGKAKTVSKMRDAATQAQTVVAKDSTMKDFYNRYDPYAVTDADKKKYEDYLSSLTEDERKTLNSKNNFYTLTLKNKGGLPMPIIVRMEFEDGTDSVARFPAEIWRFNDLQINKVIATSKKVTQWTLDPFQEIADIDTENNSFPRVSKPTRFQLFKQQGGGRGGAQGPNPMQQQRQSTQPPARQGGAPKNE